jgi:hypothetical protein
MKQHLTRRYQFIILIFLFAVFVLFGALPTTAGQGVLDGKVFIGATGDKGKDANDEDELKFEDGKFYSVGCERWEFGWGEYTTTMEGDLVHFKAVTKSPKNEQMEWVGTVKGNEINGTYTWTKKKGKRIKMREYWFEGSLK